MISVISFKIKLDSVDKVKDFIKKAFKQGYNIDITSDRYVIDGKSLMGIFTLDLSKELNVICHSDDVDEVDVFKETIKDYIV